MFAIIYLFRKPVPVKPSYFSFNLGYGQKQIAKPKWKSCRKKLRNLRHLTKFGILVSNSNLASKSVLGVNTTVDLQQKS